VDVAGQAHDYSIYRTGVVNDECTGPQAGYPFATVRLAKHHLTVAIRDTPPGEPWVAWIGAEDNSR
jgi:hypothetical protein